MSGGHLMDMYVLSVILHSNTDQFRGANWIHGSDNNPIADIAERTNTISHTFEEDHVIIDGRGTPLDPALAAELSASVWGIVVRAFQYSDENCAEIDDSKSLMDFFREYVPTIEEDAEKQALIYDLAHMWGAFVGESINKQSLKYMFLEECIDGGELPGTDITSADLP